MPGRFRSAPPWRPGAALATACPLPHPRVPPSAGNSGRRSPARFGPSRTAGWLSRGRPQRTRRATNPARPAASTPTSNGTSRKTGQLLSGLPPEVDGIGEDGAPELETIGQRGDADRSDQHRPADGRCLKAEGFVEPFDRARRKRIDRTEALVADAPRGGCERAGIAELGDQKPLASLAHAAASR